jgi:hypothetical protein
MRRDAPQIDWRAVLAGAAAGLLASLAVAAVAAATGPAALTAFATPVGLAAGGAVAGRVSGRFGLLQGGMVGVLWIVAEAIAGTVEPQTSDVVSDLALVILGDALRVAIAGAAGWAGARTATPSSYRGTGRGR